MAKNFGKAGSARIISEVAKASAEKANVITVKMISNENLIDYPNNNEDVLHTADLENSIKELGFTDPIEVTNFNTEEGKYTIVSGHRRRAAGVKCNMSVFPCIVKTFNSEADVHNYVLLANSQRDSAKDPLLFCKRYKMHEEYLKSNGFKGSMGEEIAKRLGIGVAQANRYKQFNKVILPVWDMVRDEIVGMSSVVSMGTFEVSEQEEILKILHECNAEGNSLTRDICKKIIDGYKEGKRKFSEIIESKESESIKDSGMPLNSSINIEPSETKDTVKNRNDEIRREYDPNNPLNEKDPYADERLTEEDYDDMKELNSLTDKKSLTDEEKQEKVAKDIIKHLGKLDTCINNIYKFSSSEEAQDTLKNMSNLFSSIVDEMYNISKEYEEGIEDVFKKELNEMKMKINQYT